MALIAGSLAAPQPGAARSQPDPDIVGASVARIETLNAVGTGFVVAPGRVLTAAHVVEGAADPTVIIGDENLTGRVIAADPRLDVALIDVATLSAPALALSPEPPQVLDDVYAFGNPLGGATSASRGIVSAVNDRTVQTDAAVNPGNSGGPLLNDAGDVVGLVISKNAEAEGVSFAVPVDRLRAFVGEAGVAPEPPASQPSSESDTQPTAPAPTAPAPATPTTSTPARPPDGSGEREVEAAEQSPVNARTIGALIAAALVAALVAAAVVRHRRHRRLVITPGDLAAQPLSPPAPRDEERIVVGTDVVERNTGHE
jgi:S1-C subfamily serine protease